MAGQEPWVFLNDGFVPASRAGLRVYDLGVVLGATVSEMTRTYRHEPFRLDDHVERFFRSASMARLRQPMSPEEMASAARELIAHNAALLEPAQDLALVQFLTPGESAMYAGPIGVPDPPEPTLVMHTFLLPFARWRHFFTDGVHVVVPSVRHVPPECVDPRMKCRSRMHWWLAMKEAGQVDPKAVPLCLNLQGQVTETPGANFLTVRGGQVFSPPGQFILPGISMQTVRELCVQLGIGFGEAEMTPEDVADADEAILTGTPYGIAPVTRIDGTPIGSGRPDGPVFAKLVAAWSQLVGVDIVSQILERA